MQVFYPFLYDIISKSFYKPYVTIANKPVWSGHDYIIAAAGYIVWDSSIIVIPQRIR